MVRRKDEACMPSIWHRGAVCWRRLFIRTALLAQTARDQTEAYYLGSDNVMLHWSCPLALGSADRRGGPRKLLAGSFAGDAF